MATNITHSDSEKFQKALTLQDRILIGNILATNRNQSGDLTITLNDISNMLQKDPSTISKEVKKHRTPIDMEVHHLKFTLSYCKSCKNNHDCKLKKNNKGKEGPCESYEKYVCKHLTHFPWVCNGCSKRGMCSSAKSYYDAEKAQADYKYTLKDSRIGVLMSQEDFKMLDQVISNGISKGQSVEHIIHSNNLQVSASTVYRYLKSGFLEAKPIDTHRMMRLRIKTNKKAYNSLILKELKKGRNYEDFMNLIKSNPGLFYTEMDTVEGTKGGKVVLSLKIVQLQFQFYFLLEEKKAKCVVDKLNEIQNAIGIENYKKLFGIILTDNGTEFTDIEGIITDPNTKEIRTNLFFCQPLQSGQKGSCERNHELFRYVLPKGKTFDPYNDYTFSLITSHVNSYKRKSTDFSTPIEKFCAFYENEILEKLNIKLIPANEVTLTKDLIK